MCKLNIETAQAITYAQKYKASREKVKLRQEALIKRRKAAGFSRLPSIWVKLDETNMMKLSQLLKTSSNKALKSIIKSLEETVL